MYCLNLLAIAMELASEDPAYEDVASKFWEHFLYIANAINHLGSDGDGMWNEEDGFFYDVLHMPDDGARPAEGALDGRADSAVRGGNARARSLSTSCHGFKRRMEWFIENRQDLTHNVACMRTPGRRTNAGCSRSWTAEQLRQSAAA